MVAGGQPARQRTVLTLSIGGAVFASFVLGMCCQPLPPETPDVPQQPDPPVIVTDAEAPGVDAADGAPAPPADAAPARCEFVGPRKRGGRPPDPRIVGGKPAQTGAFPFAAAIATQGGFQYCGGSIIAGRYALTAAHCQVEAGDRVLVGSTDLGQARRVPVIESRIHPRFSQETLDYDVAIAVLGEDAGVPAVPIATGVTALDATVIGWGKTCEGCATTQHLREVSIPLWEAEQCSAVYSGLTGRQVCAGLAAGGKDSCQGDSGGSLLVWNIDHWEQLGIVSWGVGCARPNAPGVYSDLRAAELREWVAACVR